MRLKLNWLIVLIFKMQGYYLTEYAFFRKSIGCVRPNDFEDTSKRNKL